MRDADWTLTYPGTVFTFGDARGSIVLESAPEVSAPEFTVDDSVRPRADGVAFGQDFRGGPTITFSAAAHAATEREARALVTQFAAAWRADRVRLTAGEVAALTGRIGGEYRTVYGRPRRFAADVEYAPQGLIRITADFACVDDCAYSVDTETAALTLWTPPTGGGLTEHLSEPMSVVGATVTPGSLAIVGDGPAWPVVELTGPVTNPSLTVYQAGPHPVAWTLALAHSIPRGETLVIDTRPWRRTITRASDGASFAGALAWQSTPLAEASLPPGAYEVSFRGTDQTGTARAAVTWHTTYYQTV